MHRMCHPVRACATILTGVALMLSLQGTAHANPRIYREVLRSTGWVVVPDKHDIAAGTCFVIDKKHRLAITCAHVVGKAREAIVYFPVRDKGELKVDSGYYLKNLPAVKARVLAADFVRDLALLQLDALPAGVEQVPLASKNPEPGEVVHSIGNSGLADSGTLWWYTRGNVRQVFNKRIHSAKGIVRVQVIETQSPVNKGDSGGPVVNNDGQLVGVAASYTTQERLVSQNIGTREVKAFLGRALLAQYQPAHHLNDQHQTTVGTKAKPPSAPPTKTYSLVGHWKFTIHDHHGKQIKGLGRFQKDETFVLSSTPKPHQSRIEKGRFACANGVLLLIGGEDTAIVPMTWTDSNHFQFESKRFTFKFERQSKA